MSDNLDFTVYSEDKFYDVVDMENFLDEDAQTIYNHLNKNMTLIPFGNYLKRYIFRHAGFSGDFNEIDLKDYQYMLMDSFEENFTPKSFTETASKMSVLAKNWLTQTSVNRKVIFLLGFGLGMSTQDVSEFLIHSQRERDFNFKDPFEVICWYCFKKGYKYPKFVELSDRYNEIKNEKTKVNFDSTIGIRDLFLRINNDEDLLGLLAKIETDKDTTFSKTAKRNFDELYQKVCEIIAEQYNEDESTTAVQKSKDYLDSLDNSDKLSFEEKFTRAMKIRDSAKHYVYSDITESDVEKFLCCGVPFDGKGNLLKFSNSTLAKHFSNKRMSRKHIHDILHSKCDVDRFDLITLNFFINAMDEQETKNKRRYIKFVESTNKILSECSMGELYIANPYECFLLMCILSDWPMGVYSDVLEQSFEATPHN